MRIAIVLLDESYQSFHHGIVYGEEIMALGMRRALRARADVEDCVIMTPNIVKYLGLDVSSNFDVAIHFYYPTIKLADTCNVLYFQQFYNWPTHDLDRYAREFDGIWTPAMHVAEGDILYMPLGVDPDDYTPDLTADADAGVAAFVGNRRMRSLARYDRYLGPHLAQGLRIYGSGWDEPGYEAYAAAWQGMAQIGGTRSVYNRAGVSLCVHNEDYVARFGLATDRSFHSILCGTPVISDRIDALEAMLPHGVGVLYTSGGADSLEMREAALARRDALVAEGQRHILARHTWAHRARAMIAHIRAISRRPLGAPEPPPRQPTVGGASEDLLARQGE